MSEKRYWIGITRPRVWAESNQKYPQNQEPRPFGFRTTLIKSVEGMQVGDRLVQYMSKRKLFLAVFKITKSHFHNPEHEFDGESFPECVEVKPIVLCSPSNGVPIEEVSGSLLAFSKLKNPKNWSSVVRRGATRLDPADGAKILEALQARHR